MKKGGRRFIIPSHKLGVQLKTLLLYNVCYIKHDISRINGTTMDAGELHPTTAHNNEIYIEPPQYVGTVIAT